MVGAFPNKNIIFDGRLTGSELVMSGATSGNTMGIYSKTANKITIDTLKTDAFKAYMQATVPVGRYGNEGELNSAAIFLAADESAYVTGVILPVDGGYTCI